MRTTFVRAHHGEVVDLDAVGCDLRGAEPSLVAVSAIGVRCELSVGSGLGSIWVSQCQRLNLTVADGKSEIDPGSVRVCSPDERPRLQTQRRAHWVALIANPAAWESLFLHDRRFSANHLPLPMVLEASQRALASVWDLLSEELQHDDPRTLIEDVLTDVLERQSEAITLAESCPGRSHARRLQVLQRLMRVKLRVDQGPPTGIDLAELARIASYSVPHFARLFHKVFGMPPHEYVLRERMHRAMALLADGNLAISEVAEILGATSHSAFSRQFRRRFGKSASELLAQLRPKDDFIKKCAAVRAESPSDSANDFLTYGTCRAEAAAFYSGDTK